MSALHSTTVAAACVGLSARLDATIAGIVQASADEIVGDAHKACPYFDAATGNIDIASSIARR